MAKPQCEVRFMEERCIGEVDHPGQHLYGVTSKMSSTPVPFDWSFFPDGLSEMYGIPDDPLKSALPPIDKSADWSAKDRQIEWVRANFTSGMLAKLYKLSYDVDGLRRDACDGIIRKEKP